MRWMLEAAGMPPRGLIGEIKVRALGAIWLDVLRVWAKDDSPDLAQTMKSLDKRLGQAEQWANTFEHRRRPPNPFRRPSEPETEPAGDDIAAAFDAEAAADGTAREGVAGGGRPPERPARAVGASREAPALDLAALPAAYAAVQKSALTPTRTVSIVPSGWHCGQCGILPSRPPPRAARPTATKS